MQDCLLALSDGWTFDMCVIFKTIYFRNQTVTVDTKLLIALFYHVIRLYIYPSTIISGLKWYFQGKHVANIEVIKRIKQCYFVDCFYVLWYWTKNLYYWLHMYYLFCNILLDLDFHTKFLINLFEYRTIIGGCWS